MACQHDVGQRGEGIDWNQLEFVLSHIAVGAMCMWLAGKLEDVEVDEEDAE